MVPGLLRVLWRLGLAVALTLIWVLLLLGAVTADQVAADLGHRSVGNLIAVVLTMAAGGYVYLVVGAASLLEDEPGGGPGDPAEGSARGLVHKLKEGVVTALGLLVIVGGFMVVPFCGFIIALGFPGWYLDHYGVDTGAIVTAEHCDGGQAPWCEQSLRVTAASTERDLGWVGCNGTGHWKAGELAQVRADPHGWINPHIANCSRDDLALDIVIPATVALAGVVFTTVAVAPLPRTTNDRGVPQSERTDGLNEDTPGEADDLPSANLPTDD